MKHLHGRKPNKGYLYTMAVALVLFAGIAGMLLGATRLQFGEAVTGKILLMYRHDTYETGD